LDKGELYTRFARLFSGGELSLPALHDWVLEVRNASAAVVGTEYWAPRKELDSLQSCARIPMDILVAVNATHPADFGAFISSLEAVTRARMKTHAKRLRGKDGSIRPNVASVHFSGDEVPARDNNDVHRQLEALQEQVAALQLVRGGGGKGKGGGKGGVEKGAGVPLGGGAKGEARVEGVRCFVCDGPHYAKKCPVVVKAKADLASSSSSTN
jgi:hypothetical protein